MTQQTDPFFGADGTPSNAALPVLLEVLDAMTLESDFASFFAKAAGAIAKLIGADGAALLLLEEDGRTLQYRVFEGACSERLQAFVGMRFPVDRGVAGRAVREHRAQHVPDYPASADAMPAFVDAGLKSNIAIPLITANQPIGVLVGSWFERTQSVRLEPGLLGLVERIGAQIAVAAHRDALEARLRALAVTDPLTGAASRRGITTVLEDKLALYRRLRQPFAVFMIDLDGFKAANDLCGHALGDSLLRDAAGRLRDVLRKGDQVGRLGGDEFLVVAKCPAERVPRLARRLLQALRIAFGAGRLSASIGCATCPTDGTDADTLLRRADLAMYASKQGGGNGYRHFVPALENELARERSAAPRRGVVREHLTESERR